VIRKCTRDDVPAIEEIINEAAVFTFKFQGLDQKLTGTEKKAVVVKDILA
jgi:hypothetical protein